MRTSRHVVLVVLALTQVAAVPWPLESDWIPVFSGGSLLEDACSDSTDSDSTDLVGDSMDGVAFWYDDGTYTWFRLRLGDKPHKNAKSWQDGAWGLMFDTDGDTADYEYATFLHGPTQRVLLVADTEGGDPVGVDHNSRTLIKSWAAAPAPSGWAITGAAGYVSAGSTVCGNGPKDWYLEIRVPTEVFGRIGVSVAGTSVVVGTWAPGTDFSADVAACDGTASSCATFTDDLSDPL